MPRWRRWFDLPFLRVVSYHTSSAIAVMIGVYVTGKVADIVLSDGWLKSVLHSVEEFVTLGLTLVLVVRLTKHLLRR